MKKLPQKKSLKPKKSPEPVSDPVAKPEVSLPSTQVSTPSEPAPIIVPSAQTEAKKKETEVEVIADYSGSQGQTVSSPIENSSNQAKEAVQVSDEAAKPISQEMAVSEVPKVPLDSPLNVERSEEKEEEPQLEKSNKKIFIIGIVITIAAIFITAVFAFYFLRQDSNKKAPVKEEKVEATFTPAPKKTLNRAKWSIEVLNGTFTPGVAKELADKLKDLGYMIVETGNADESDYKTSKIFVSSDKNSNEIGLLLEDIKDIIEISSSSGDLEGSTVSARIIIGKDYEAHK